MDKGQQEQLAQILEKRYFACFPSFGQSSNQTQEKLTRSLAAFVISKLADVDEATACAAVIDGYNDNGIDALHYDQSQNQLILVQSKYKTTEPNHSEVSKFVVGIKDLKEKKFNRFNNLFQQKISDLDDALENPSLKIIVVLAHLGNELQAHAQRQIDDLLREFNQYSPLVEYKNFGAEQLMLALRKEHTPSEVTTNIELEHWGGTDRKVFYGQVSVSTLHKLFLEHGKNLFAKNIRYYIGESAVNQAIAETLRVNPEHLILMNNGLTAICNHVNVLPKSTSRKGELNIEGFSVVNGAQTIGAIADVGKETDLQDSPGRILLTLISLEDQQHNLGTQITQARNFQNRVKQDDFAAQDPNQERLRQEFAMSGVVYHVRSRNKPLREEDNFNITLETASLSLAAFHHDTGFIVQAKQSPLQLRNPQSQIYKQLFSDNLSASELCRKVRIYHFLESLCLGNQETTDTQTRLFYRHLNLLLIQKTFHAKPELADKTFDALTDAEKLELSSIFAKIATKYFDSSQQLLVEANSDFRRLSRNLTDLKQVIFRVNNK